MAPRRVAIIGAGPSGLVALKECMEAGLEATAFERSGRLGGIWSHGVWDSLRVNLSRATCCFSDFPWAPSADEYPTGEAMRAYLEAYADRFHLRPHIRLRSHVRCSFTVSGWSVERHPEASPEAGTDGYGEFDFLVVASGIFDRPHWPSIPGLDQLPHALVLHSQQYRNLEELGGSGSGGGDSGDGGEGERRPLLVVGGAFSGAEIAADLSASGARVLLSTRTAHYYLPTTSEAGVPLDLLFYQYGAAPAALEERHARLREIGLPMGLPSPDARKEPRVAITDRLGPELRRGAVRLCAAVQSFGVRSDGSPMAFFADGSSEGFARCVLATGFDSSALGKMLPQELLEGAEYMPNDQLMPLLLPLETLHPFYRTVAFVGYYRGPFFGVIELQARLAAALFAGRCQWPSPDGMSAMVAEARERRCGSGSAGRRQFSQDYPAHAAALATTLGAAPPTVLPTVPALPLVPALFRLRELASLGRSWQGGLLHRLRPWLAWLLLLDAQLSKRPPAMTNALGGRVWRVGWRGCRWVVRAIAWALGLVAVRRLPA